MYIVNTPKSITIPWAICKSFIEPITVEKIQFFNNSIPQPIFEHINLTQLEI